MADEDTQLDAPDFNGTEVSEEEAADLIEVEDDAAAELAEEDVLIPVETEEDAEKEESEIDPEEEAYFYGDRYEDQR